MHALIGFGDRLFRHDRAIAVNSIRANLSRWSDRILAAGMLAAVLAVAHSWSAEQSWRTAALVAGALAAAAGLGAGRLLAARFAFHRHDGVLAAQALQSALARRFAMIWHGTAITVIVAVTLVARPSLLLVAVPAYGAGASLARLADALATRRAVAKFLPRRSIRAWLPRPIAGVAAAAILSVIQLLAGPLGANGGHAVIAIVTLFFTALLTSVDHAVIRYRASVGHRAWRIAAGHAAALMIFAALAAPLGWAITGVVATAMIAAICVAMLGLMILRVLAYYAHPKRIADVLVAVMIGVLGLTAYGLIFLLPLVAGIMLWWLHRNAAARRWLIE